MSGWRPFSHRLLKASQVEREHRAMQEAGARADLYPARVDSQVGPVAAAEQGVPTQDAAPPVRVGRPAEPLEALVDIEANETFEMYLQRMRREWAAMERRGAA